MAKPRLLKILMAPLFGLPAPVANLALGVAIYFRWQDFYQIMRFSVLTVAGREGAQCQLCDTVMMFAMKEAKLNKLKGGLDCKTVCFGFSGGRCGRMCDAIKSSMNNSTQYPCQAAGFCPQQKAIDDFGEVVCRWSYKQMGCLPAGGVCRHRLPTTCELAPGIRRWRRMKRFVLEDMEQLGAAFAKRAKYCSEPGASPRSCIRDASGVGLVCQNLGYALIASIGTYRTVHAIESPGGADDRQWLVFWLLMFACSFAERFTDLLLSWLPRYYELKLLFLCWLMKGGGEKLYRKARRYLQLQSVFGRHFGTVARNDDEYLGRLPIALREEVEQKGGITELRPVLESLCTSEEDLSKRYDGVTVKSLMLHWNAVDPAVVVLRVKHASNLPVMDPSLAEELSLSSASATHAHHRNIQKHHDKVDAYVVANLVPPADPFLAARGHDRLVSLWTTKRHCWSRVRLFVHVLLLVVAWRKRVTSFQSVRSAARQRWPVTMVRRLVRFATIASGEAINRLIGARAESLVSMAFHGGPVGPLGQYGKRRTRCKWGTNDPHWNETLELRLPSRVIGKDGSLSGDTVAPFTKLRLELWDRDLFSRDDFIGEVTLPLTPAMDGRTHVYTLPLTDPEGAFAAKEWGAQLRGEVTVEVSVES